MITGLFGQYKQEVDLMSTVDLKKRKRAVKISKAINSIEGVPVSEKTESIYSQWADGKITGEQMKAQILQMYSRA